MQLHLTSFALCKVCCNDAGVVFVGVRHLDRSHTHTHTHRCSFIFSRCGRDEAAALCSDGRGGRTESREPRQELTLTSDWRVFLQLFSLESPPPRILLTPAPPLFSLSAACRPVVDALILIGDNEHLKHSPVFRGMLYVVQNVMC